VRPVNEEADVLVVEEVDVLPRDALPLVLLLLLLEHQLNEELLKLYKINVIECYLSFLFSHVASHLLVAIVDAKLLEAVVVKHLEAVNVEDADHGGLEMRLALCEGGVDGGVDVAHDPGEEAVVERLGERVQGDGGLRDSVRLAHDL
jgi:hypothetical protein